MVTGQGQNSGTTHFVPLIQYVFTTLFTCSRAPPPTLGAEKGLKRGMSGESVVGFVADLLLLSLTASVATKKNV